MKPLAVAAFAAMTLVSAPSAFGVAISFNSLTCSNASGGGACSAGVDNIWNTGDFLLQTFTSTGLASVNQLGLNLVLFDNLTTGQNEIWDISVNTTVVGNLSVTGSGTSSFINTFNFAPIAGIGSGTDYTVQFTVRSPGVPGGNGTLGLPNNASTGSLNSTASVPEPGTMTLVGAAIAALCFARRKLTAVR